MRYLSVHTLLIFILGVNSNKEIDFFQNDYILTVQNAIQNGSLTNLCVQQLKVYLKDLKEEKLWAVQSNFLIKVV